MAGCDGGDGFVPAAGVTGGNDGGVGISAGTQSASTGTIIFSNSNGVTFGMSGSSVVTASVATVAGMGLSAGTQSVSTGTVVFSNSNNVTFGMSGSSRVTASASFPAETPFGVSAGTQSVSTGTVVFSNSNNVTFGMSGSSQVTASASFPAETPFGVSAGTQSVSTGTLVFSNSNNVTFGMSGSSRVTASASFPAETPFGISAGTQSVSTGTLVFSNSNNVTFGMSGSSLVTASASETPFAVSAGTQSVSTGTVILSNANGISFGMAGSNTITASYASALSQFAPIRPTGSATVAMGFESVWPVQIPSYMTVTQIVFLASGALAASNTTNAGTVSLSFGIYTLSQSTASLASSTSRAFTWVSGNTNSTSVAGGFSNWRYRTLGGSYAITPGQYMFAMHQNSSSDGQFRFLGEFPSPNLNAGTYDGVESGAGGLWLAGTLNGDVSFGTAMVASFEASASAYARTGQLVFVPCVSLFGSF